jgi:hypothetical protein
MAPVYPRKFIGADRAGPGSNPHRRSVDTAGGVPPICTPADLAEAGGLTDGKLKDTCGPPVPQVKMGRRRTTNPADKGVRVLGIRKWTPRAASYSTAVGIWTIGL